MTITLVSSVVYKNGSFGLGNEEDLLYKIPNDLKFFKNLKTYITSGFKNLEQLITHKVNDSASNIRKSFINHSSNLLI